MSESKEYDGYPGPAEQDNGTCIVSRDELDQLIQQNADLKVQNGEMLIDLHTIVHVFGGLKDLFSGKPSMMKLPAIIGKLMNDQKAMARLETLGPILEKYSPKSIETIAHGKES